MSGNIIQLNEQFINNELKTIDSTQYLKLLLFL